MIQFNKEEFRLSPSQMHIIAMESNNTLHAVLMAQDFIVGNVFKALLQAGGTSAKPLCQYCKDGYKHLCECGS